MKKLLSTILILLLLANCRAATYYFSEAGISTNTGLSESSPWNLARFVAEMGTGGIITGGDVCRFKRGDRFFSATPITVQKSGTALAPIVIGAYGTGVPPIFTGFVRVTQWTGGTSGIYTSLSGVGTLTDADVVLVNGELRRMARWPNYSTSAADNYGWIRGSIAGSGVNLYVASSTLPLATANNLRGARVVARTNQWTIDTASLASAATSGSNTVLTLSRDISGDQKSGYGHYYQNRADFIDQDYEWHFNGADKRLSIKLPSDPVNHDVRIAMNTQMFTLAGQSHIQFEDLIIEGLETNGVQINGTSQGLKFTRVYVQYVGAKGITAQNSSGVSNVTITDSEIKNIGNFGLDHQGSGSYFTVTNSLFENIGTTAIVDAANAGQQGVAIRGRGGVEHLYTGNTFRSIGYCAFRFAGAFTQIGYNKIFGFNERLGDAGAIYCGTSSNKDGVKIFRNYIDGATTARVWEGTSGQGEVRLGIYLDDASRGSAANPIEITENIVVNCSKAALYIHNNQHIKVLRNTFYGNEEAQVQIINDGSVLNANNTTTYEDSTNNIIFKGNLCVTTNPSSGAFVMKMYTLWDNPALIAKFDEPENAPRGSNVNNGIDSNYYFKPFHQAGKPVWAIWNLYNQNGVDGEIRRYYDLVEWASLFTHDRATKGPPVFFSSTAPQSSLRLVANMSLTDSVVTVSRPYRDQDGDVIYPGTFTLAPWQTKVLFETDDVPVPPPPPPPPVVVVENPVIGYRGFKPLLLGGKAAVSGGRLLVEPIPVYRQNRFVWSQEFTNAAWNKNASAITITAGATLAPDSTMTGQQVTIVGSGTSYTRSIQQPMATMKDSVYTISVFAKDISRRYLQVVGGLAGFGNQVFANFDLQTGQVMLKGANVISAGVDTAKFGWREYYITAKASATSSGVNNSFNLVTAGAAIRSQTYQTSTPTAIWLWGAQFATNEKRKYSKTEAAAIQ